MGDSGPSLSDRFVGCLLGLAIGDALGAISRVKHLRASLGDTGRLNN